MDGTTRRNAGTSMDEKVAIKKITAKNATKITFSPTDQLRLQGGDEYLKQVFEGRAFSKGDVIALNVMGNKMELVVTSFAPSGEAAMMTSATQVKVSEKPRTRHGDIPKVSYDDIGDLATRSTGSGRWLSFRSSTRTVQEARYRGAEGRPSARPPGNGKAMLAKAVAGETSSNFVYIGGPEIMSKFLRRVGGKAQGDLSRMPRRTRPASYSSTRSTA